MEYFSNYSVFQLKRCGRLYRENDNIDTKAIERYMGMEQEEREKLMLELETEVIEKAKNIINTKAVP